MPTVKTLISWRGAAIVAVAVTIILSLLLSSMFWGVPFKSMQRYQTGEKTTWEIYGKHGELVKRYTTIDPDGDPSRHTLKFVISGSKMQGIKITNMDLKSAPGTVVLKIAADATKFIYLDKITLKNVDAARLEVRNSDLREIILTNISADGASTYVNAAAPDPLPLRAFSNYNKLPVWSVDASEYDVVEIVASADAEVVFLKLDTVKIPGDAVLDGLKANRLEIKDSTVGNGDGLTNKDFLFTNVKSNNPNLSGVNETPVDNTR